MVVTERVVASIIKMDDTSYGQQYNFLPTAVISDHLCLPLTSHLISLVVPLDVSKTNTESELNGAKYTISPTAAAPCHPREQVGIVW